MQKIIQSQNHSKTQKITAAASKGPGSKGLMDNKLIKRIASKEEHG
jgi:hypothetical protein